MSNHRTPIVSALFAAAIFIACGGKSEPLEASGPITGTAGASAAASGATPSDHAGASANPNATASVGNGTAGHSAPIGTGGGSAAAGSGTGAPTGADAGSGSAAVSGGAGVAAAGTGTLGAAGDTSAGSSGAGAIASVPGSCESLPPVSDYSMPGPFADAKMFSGVGPSNNYHLFRPDTSLGKDGFKHPVATWGNGIATTPDQYEKTLDLIASHGFVIIACDDTMAERPCLSDGMDWLVMQNDVDGPLKGKLDVSREIAIGYSWGGGAAIDTSNRPNVKATVSLHGMPPRQSDAFDSMHSPLLLFTSTGDSFVTADGYVTPNYDMSKVQTFYATLDDSTAGHLYVVDPGAVTCVASVALGDCMGDVAEHAPTIAWLRYWVCGDQGAKAYFYGDDCTLCQKPWIMPQRKMWQ